MVTRIRPSLGQLHLVVAFDDVAFRRDYQGRVIQMRTIAKRSSHNRVNMSVATLLKDFFLGRTELSGAGVRNDVFKVACQSALGKVNDAGFGLSSFTDQSADFDRVRDQVT